MNYSKDIPFGKLREIRDDELELMLAWRNAPGVRVNMYSTHEISLNEHLAWWKKTLAKNDQLYFMYENDGIPCGIVAFNEIDQKNRNAFWAFYASPVAPKGTGSKMEYLALEHAFSKLNLHKLNCEVLEFNAAVIKLHEKFGFKTEGIFRDQHSSDGKFVNIHRLGILSSEWDDNSHTMFEKLLYLHKTFKVSK